MLIALRRRRTHQSQSAIPAEVRQSAIVVHATEVILAVWVAPLCPRIVELDFTIGGANPVVTIGKHSFAGGVEMFLVPTESAGAAEDGGVKVVKVVSLLLHAGEQRI